MSEPVKRSHWSLHREPSYVLLMLGIVLTTFGFSGSSTAAILSSPSC